MTAASSPITLGIIGCGRATEQLHLPALQSVPSIRVVAVADQDRARLDATAGRFAIPARYSEAGDLIGIPELDAVAICTPVSSHARLVLDALAAGKHVFVEKPLALHVAEGSELVRAREAAGKVGAIGLNLRCHRLMQRARAMIAAGELGEVHQIITTWGTSIQHDPAMVEWRRKRETGGGVLYEIGVHHIDAAAFLLGDRIASVQALNRSASCDDESVSLLARTDKNTLITANFSQVTAWMNEFRIIGDEGALWFSLFRADSFLFSSRARTHRGWRGRLDRMPALREIPELLRVARGGGDFGMAYQEQWLRFAAAIRDNGAPASSFADGLAALKALEAAKASLESGAMTSVAV